MSALVPSPAEAGVIVVYDPTGDLLAAGPDLTRIVSNNGGSDLILTLDFADAVSPASAGLADSVIGFINLDVDRKLATGLPGNDPDLRSAEGGDTAPPNFANLLGVDYFADLNDVLSPGSVDVASTTGPDAFTAVGTGLLSQPSSTSLRVTIPLSIFSDGPVPVDPFVNFAVGVATLGSQFISDVAIAPEPGSIVHIGLGAVVLLGYRGCRRLRTGA